MSDTSWYNMLEFSGYPNASFNLGPASNADLALRAKDGNREAEAELERRNKERRDALLNAGFTGVLLRG